MAAQTVQDIAQAGVVGAGGAGFPTHVKLSARADTVLINAAECEPLLHKDKQLLRNFGEQVVEGLAVGMRLTGAGRGIVGIKEKYTDVIEALAPKLGSGMTIAPLKDAYPAGDEFILVYDVLGRIIPPGGIPLHVGAVVMNVETAYNVAQAPQPVVEKFVSVAGAVREPVTLRAPLGVTLGQCVQAAGGSTADGCAYVVGGVMMGRLGSAGDLVDKTTGAVIVLPGDHAVVRRLRRDYRQVSRIGRSACDQCSFCTELCPRYLLGHPVEPHRAMRSLGFNLVGEPNVLGTLFCCECNLCSMYSCPEGLDPRDVCRAGKRSLLAQGRRWADPPISATRARTHMANRKAPMHRLMQRLGLTRFVNVGPLSDKVLASGKVGIRLKQHAGATCEPAVAVGRQVRRGQVVGQPPSKEGKMVLGALVHASIDGTVAAIEDGVVWIEK